MKIVGFASVMMGGALSMVACSAPDRTVVAGEEERGDPPVLIDSIQWNGETLAFYDVMSEEGTSEVAVTMLGPDREPELTVLLERQLGRSPSAAELWLSAGGAWEDLPAELLANHEARARVEGGDTALERREVEIETVEKAIDQSFFNAMFPLDPASTGFPSGSRVCWDALMTQVQLGFGKKRVCSHNGNAIVNFTTQPSCDPILAINTRTLRTGLNNFTGGPLKGYSCFQTGTAAFALQCTPATVNGGFYYALSFIRNGTEKHRLGSGAEWTGVAGPDLDNQVLLGSAELNSIQVPPFQSTTCTAH